MLRQITPTRSRRFLGQLALGLSLAALASPAVAQEDPEKRGPLNVPVSKLPLKAIPFDKKPVTLPQKLLGKESAPAQPAEKFKADPGAEAKEPPPLVLSGEDSPPALGDLTGVKSGRCKPQPPGRKVQLNFEGDILQLVAMISKTTCRNFILTNKVRSQKFSIVSPTPITVDEAWRAFLSSLEANDFSVIQVGRYYKIIQAQDGTRAPVPFYEPGQETPIDDRIVTKIYRMRYAADLNNVVNYLNIFKSAKGQIHPYLPTGTIIATDFGTSMERLDRVIHEIDRPGALEEIHIVPVEFASASEIAEKLSAVFEPAKNPQGGAKAPGSRIKMRTPAEQNPLAAPGDAPTPAPQGEAEAEGESLSVSKILADDRTNKLIIIASERTFQQIMALKKELDVPDDGSDSQIQVLRLKHADAEELAGTLSALAQGKPSSGTKKSGLGSKSKPATPAIPTAPVTPGGATASLFSGEVKITSEKSTNSLLITASKSDYTQLRRVIDRLDVPRYQVFVEAVIMEISEKRNRDLGFTWHGVASPQIDGKDTPLLFGSQPQSGFGSVPLTTSPLALASLFGFAGAVRGPTAPGTEDLIPGGIPTVGVVLQALAGSNDVNVISTPHLLTLDNEEAEIQVNEKIPFSSGVTLGGLSNLAGAAGGQLGQLGGALGGLGLGSLSFQREDVGLTLKLKPQINDEDYVRLEIDQELSDVAGVDQVTNQTITSKRSAKTTVVVRSQDSVVIGGLQRDRESVDESKVPLFGDLPLLGWLFKKQKKTVDKVNLLLVLTPYIIRGPADFQTIFERKMAERKEFAERFRGAVPEYDAQIDWSRKRGVLASYRFTMSKELAKAENEGPGGDDQLIIKPEGVEEGGQRKPSEPRKIGPAGPAVGPSAPPPPPITPPIEDPPEPEPPVEP